MKTSGEDKFTDLEELNILIIGETGFPHLDIVTNQFSFAFQEPANQPG